MKIKKGKSGTVVAYNVKLEELINLLKVQIKMYIGFKLSESDTEYSYKFWLLNRTVNNNQQKIEISLEMDGSNSEVVSYDVCLEKLKTALSGGFIYEVVFESRYFNKKAPLIDIIGKVKPALISGCVYIDYDDGMLSIVNKNKNNLPNKLFFWEDTSSLFIFGEDGPNLIYQSNYDSIEDLLL